MQQQNEINRLDVRVSILEATHTNLLKTQSSHEVIIEKLLTQDTDAAIALKLINQKFDALLNQFSIGFRIICVCSVIVCTTVGAVWAYTHDLDQRYAPKFETLLSNSSIQKNLSQSNLDKINQITREKVNSK